MTQLSLFSVVGDERKKRRLARKTTTTTTTNTKQKRGGLRKGLLISSSRSPTFLPAYREPGTSQTRTVLRHFLPTGIVHHAPTISHYRSCQQLRYSACHTLPLMNEPLDKLAPLFPDLHLGRKRVSGVLQKGLSLGVLNLYHYSRHISSYRRNSFTEVLRSLIQPVTKKVLLKKKKKLSPKSTAILIGLAQSLTPCC